MNTKATQPETNLIIEAIDIEPKTTANTSSYIPKTDLVLDFIYGTIGFAVYYASTSVPKPINNRAVTAVVDILVGGTAFFLFPGLLKNFMIACYKSINNRNINKTQI